MSPSPVRPKTGSGPPGGTESRGSRPACADVDGTKDSRVSWLAVRSARELTT
jgi:hypothetical protein